MYAGRSCVHTDPRQSGEESVEWRDRAIHVFIWNHPLGQGERKRNSHLILLIEPLSLSKARMEDRTGNPGVRESESSWRKRELALQERFELSTACLEDKCSSNWAIAAVSNHRRGSNSRPAAQKADALSTELLWPDDSLSTLQNSIINLLQGRERMFMGFSSSPASSNEQHRMGREGSVIIESWSTNIILLSPQHSNQTFRRLVLVGTSVPKCFLSDYSINECRTENY